MTFILVVAVAVLALMVFSLRERVSELEWKLKQNPPTIESHPTSETAVAPPALDPERPADADTPFTPASPKPRFSPASVIDAPTPEATRATIPMAKPSIVAPESSFDFVAWIKDGFLIKMGALLFFVGIGLFLSYAFANNWVTPAMRILIGFVIAGGVYVLSVWRLRSVVQHGLVLNALATSIVLATVFAAQFAYDLFNPTFALVLMVLAIAASVMLSMKYDSERLALAAAGAGLTVPFLTNVPEPSLFGFLSYLLVLTVSFVWVVYRTGWTNIILLLLIGVEGILFALHQGGEVSDTATILLFIGIFALVFYGAGLLSNLVRKVVSTPDLCIVGFNALTLLYWVHVLVPDVLQAAIAFLVASVAAVTAYFLLTNESDVSLAYLHTGVGLLFGFVATAYVFSGFTLTLVLTAEVAFLVGGALWFEFRSDIVNRLSFLFSLPLLSSLSSFSSSAWDTGWLHADMATLFVLAAVSLGLCVLAYGRDYDAVGHAFAVIGWLYLTAVSLLVADAVPSGHFYPWAVILLSLETTGLMVLWLGLHLPRSLGTFFAASFALPVLLSFSVAADDAWRGGWWHLPAWSLYTILAASIVVVCMAHGRMYTKLRDGFAAICVWFLVVIPWLTFDALFSGEVSQALLALLYSGYTVGALGVAIERQSRPTLLMLAASFGVLPALISLSVLGSAQWETGIFHSSFLSIFGLTLMALMLTVWTASEVRTHVQATVLTHIRDIYAWATGLYGVALVWLSTHAVFASESTAVTCLLFTYLLTGLAMYIP